MVRKQLFSLLSKIGDKDILLANIHSTTIKRVIERNMTFLDYCTILTVTSKPGCNKRFITYTNQDNNLVWFLSTEVIYLEYPYWSVTTLAPLQERYFLKTWCSWKSSTSEAKSPTNTENSGLGKISYYYHECRGLLRFHIFKGHHTAFFPLSQ